MDEPRLELVSQPTRRPDWQWILLLVALVLPLRIWILCHTEVTARDSVGYMRYALRFDEQPWGEVVRSFDQHPGYPVAIWLMSLPMRAWFGLSPEVMQLSAQLVSAIAALLLLAPMYLLGKAIGGARVGFGAALLFQFLPMSGHHLGDGISESTYLLFVTVGLLAAVRGLERRSLGWFAGCGAAGSLAYLVRPEGGLLVAAPAAALACCQLIPAWRQSWTGWLGQSACLVLPAMLLAAPYVAATGRLTNKPSIKDLFKGERRPATQEEKSPLSQTAQTGRALQASLWGHSFTSVDSVANRLFLAATTIGSEIGYALHYAGLLPLAIGVFCFGRGWLGRPATALLIVYLGLYLGGLLLLGESQGYVSDRHLMATVMLLSFVVVAGLEKTAVWLSGFLRGKAARVLALHGTGLLVAAFALCCLPQTLKPLHFNRAGNHEAGRWLAEHMQPGDLVLDDHAWAHFYAGQVFLERHEPPVPAAYQPTCYVVMTRSTDPKVARTRKRWEKSIKIAEGTLVYHWPQNTSIENARVVIYALPRNPRSHPWTVALAEQKSR